MTRDKIKHILIAAIQAAPEEDAAIAATRAATATGARRALWDSYTVEQRASLIRSAQREARRDA